MIGLIEDGENFMSGPIKMMLGYDNLVYGSSTVESGGKDGIKRGDPGLKGKL